MDLAVNLSPALAGSINFSDLDMVNGDLTLTSDATGGTTNCVLQDLNVRLRIFQGEWFMDSSIGIPWFQLTAAASRANTQLDAVLQNVICTTPGVIQLRDYASTIDTRTRAASVSFLAVSTQGPISYTTQVDATGGNGSAP